MPSTSRVSVPLLAPLIPDGVEAGTIFLIEFDPESQWLAVAATITASYLQAGGRVAYTTSLRPPEAVRESLLKSGVGITEAVIEGRFSMDDFYAATLAGGRLDGGGASPVERIEGGMRARSLKVSDLSLEMLKEMRQDPQSGILWENWPPGALSISDALSPMLRFNEEKPLLEWMTNRNIPSYRRAKRVGILGIIWQIHSESVYRWLENVVDGVIDRRGGCHETCDLASTAENTKLCS